MIDFNDTPISSDVDRQAQRDQIRSDLTSRLESALFSMGQAVQLGGEVNANVTNGGQPYQRRVELAVEVGRPLPRGQRPRGFCRPVAKLGDRGIDPRSRF